MWNKDRKTPKRQRRENHWFSVCQRSMQTCAHARGHRLIWGLCVHGGVCVYPCCMCMKAYMNVRASVRPLGACDCVFLVECLLSGTKSRCLPVRFVFKCLSASLPSWCLHVLSDITAQCVSAVRQLHSVCALLTDTMYLCIWNLYVKWLDSRLCYLHGTLKDRENEEWL